MRRVAATGCPHSEPTKEGEFSSQTRTITILHGIDPLAPEVDAARTVVDVATKSTNANCLVYLGNVVTSLHQTDIVPNHDTSELVTLLGRSELELLRFMPRPGGEIEMVLEEEPEAAALALLRPPQLLGRDQQPRQLPPKWANVYVPNLREAMTPLVELYRRVKAFENGLKQLRTTNPIVYHYKPATTSGSYKRPAGSVWASWTPATVAFCHTYHDVYCMFSVAMCLKFFYMWEQTTIYTAQSTIFLDAFAIQHKDDDAVQRLVDMCQADLAASTKRLATEHVDDDMRGACVKLMNAVSSFMNGVFCKYLTHSSGLVATVASMTNTEEEGKAAPSALYLMYEDNEHALCCVPVGSEGWDGRNKALSVTWERTNLSAHAHVENSRAHLHELLAHMCSKEPLSSALEARLSGYISVAHAGVLQGGAMKMGQVAYGTFDAHGTVHTHTLSKAEVYLQAACTVSVGMGDVGVASWCPGTASTLVEQLAPTAQAADTANLAILQDAVTQDAERHFPARRHGHKGRLGGTVRTADNKVHRITTWSKGTTMLLPETWVQTCFLDLAKRREPQLHRRPRLGVLSRLDPKGAPFAEQEVRSQWRFEHNGDQLTGLAVEWADVEPTLTGATEDALLLLVEDRANAMIHRLF
jgi:hypothetical protein